MLHGPEKDNKEQVWVDAQRGEHQHQKQQPVLNRPVCMTVVMRFDCQRHESYKTLGTEQCLVGMNCSVIREEVSEYKNPENRKKKQGAFKMRSNPDGPVETEVEEIYHPVVCTECSVEVAVCDKDEVFLLFSMF